MDEKMKNKFMTKSDEIALKKYQEEKFITSSRMQDAEMRNFYKFHDFLVLQGINAPNPNNNLASLETFEDLIKRDNQRKKDGLPKKIKIARIPSGKGKFIVVPTTEESKLVHDSFNPCNSEEGTGGQGEGEEGEVIGERPIESESEEGEGSCAGNGGGGEHGIDAEAYEYGKELVEKFNLPNLKDKGKKVAIDKYIYDLTDKHKRSGQVLDITATLWEIIKTNLLLGKIPDIHNIDPVQLVVSPDDYIFRVLSKEKEYESQAIVFFGRDYSGSMWGEPTKTIVTQHLMIYSWLMYQYGERVKTRFIVNDTEAKEVPNFDIYYRAVTGGGTMVSSAFGLINRIIAEENLYRDYNIYVFYGTDGDNWEEDNKKLHEELLKTIIFANRTGIIIARNDWGYWGGSGNNTTVEKHINESGIADEQKRFRMFSMNARDATEKKNIEAIKHLISE